MSEARTRFAACGVISNGVNVVNSNDRNKVVDPKEELNKMIEDEMRDEVVLAFANTLTLLVWARN